MQWIFPTLFLLIGAVWCETDITDRLQTLQEQFGSSISIDDVQEALKEKCETNGGAGTYDHLKTKIAETKKYAEEKFNIANIKSEIELKRQTMELDVIVSEYCTKIHNSTAIRHELGDALNNCLETEEKASFQILTNIIDALAEFSCVDDGDRIAIFIVEGGPKCIKEKKDNIEQCFNTTLSHRIPTTTTDFSLKNLPLLTINTEGCEDFHTLQTCVVDVLLKCDDTTPANIVEALFKFVRKLTPCKDYKPSKSTS